MKKVMFLLTVIIILCACTKDDEILDESTLNCYDCTIVQIITLTPTSCSFPRQLSTNLTLCGLTERNAKKFAEEQTSTSSLKTYSGTIVVENTCTLTKRE